MIRTHRQPDWFCKFLAYSHPGVHFPGVRGSPLIRSIFLILALIATGGVLARLTAAKRPAETRAPMEKSGTAPAGTSRVPYRLLLSAPASEVRIDTGGPTAAASPLSGTLELDPANPHLALIVRWTQPPKDGEHRFAKLTLEIPGQTTFTHVFDAQGDIDDFLELPVFNAKP